MYFVLGFIAGILQCVLVFVVLTYFKTKVEVFVNKSERKINPSAKGRLFSPNAPKEGDLDTILEDYESKKY